MKIQTLASPLLFLSIIAIGASSTSYLLGDWDSMGELWVGEKVEGHYLYDCQVEVSDNVVTEGREPYRIVSFAKTEFRPDKDEVFFSDLTWQSVRHFHDGRDELMNTISPRLLAEGKFSFQKVLGFPDEDVHKVQAKLYFSRSITDDVSVFVDRDFSFPAEDEEFEFHGETSIASPNNSLNVTVKVVCIEKL